MSQFSVTYDNVLFTSCQELDGFMDNDPSRHGIYSRDGFIACIKEIKVSQDDGQDDCDIKMFCSVVCMVTAKDVDSVETEVPSCLSDFLKKVVDSALSGFAYDLESTWDVLDVQSEHECCHVA